MERNLQKNEELEELLVNQLFIDWVRKPTAKTSGYWTKWIDEAPEREALVSEAKAILQTIQYKRVSLVAQRKPVVWDKIQQGNYSSRYTASKQKSSTRLISSFKFKRIAAIALILIVTGSLFVYLNYQALFDNTPDFITVVTHNGEKKNVQLPDGSMVYLNSSSRLTYPEHFKKERSVELIGEGFFEVTKNPEKPFVVSSKGYTTRALGTSFNVRAYGDERDIAMVLKTGKVVIAKPSDEQWEKVYLAPGEKLHIDGAAFEKSRYSTDDLSWHEGVLVLNKAGFPEFVKIIERWYGVEVIVNGVPGEDWRVNGRFKNKPLAVVLESISFAENINYTLQGKNVIISFKH